MYKVKWEDSITGKSGYCTGLKFKVLTDAIKAAEDLNSGASAGIKYYVDYKMKG